jgi:preprotein translocase subunit SecA
MNSVQLRKLLTDKDVEELKKYAEKANMKYDAFLDEIAPLTNNRGQFIMNDKMRELFDIHVKPMINKDAQRRNDLCKCGSGKKYKNCCGK